MLSRYALHENYDEKDCAAFGGNARFLRISSATCTRSH